MDENALLGLKCPDCGHVHMDTLAHFKANWGERFPCESCGIDMMVDREAALHTINSAEVGQSPIIEMRSVVERGRQ